MANYVKTTYEDNDGEIHPLRLSSAYAAVAGTEPEGSVTSNIPAKVTKGNREFGLRPRGVRLYRTIGTAPNAFNRSAFLPLRSIADADEEAYKPEEPITIGGVAWKVSSFVPEDYS